MKIRIVRTTINPPKFLQEYSKYPFSSVDDVKFIVVGDNKTPRELGSFIKDEYNEMDDVIPATYYGVNEQIEWCLDNLNGTNISRIIPSNSPRRRNFGYLKAIQEKADIMITIDDDNFPIKDSTSWVRGHIQSIKDCHRPIVSSRNGYINPCQLLQTEYPIYSRGYPVSEILSDSFEVTDRYNNREIAMNLGLWLKKPDVDAFTNILYPDLDVQTYESSNYIAAPDNYFPICTQNTSVHKDFLPVFNVVYQESVFGQNLDRYDDIWGGLIASKVAQECKRSISFGTPYAVHDRNSHNYENDLKKEMYGMIINTKMWNWIRDIPLESTKPIDCYLELAEWILYNNPFNSKVITDYILELSMFMTDWIGAVECLI